MSIANEITRLQNAKAALKTAINAKNDSSHQIDDETLDDYADFVDLIHDALPAAYTELAYIESNGTQYIDTGIKASGSISIKMHVIDYFSSTNAGKWCFGGRNAYNDKQYGFFIGNSGSQNNKVVFPYYDSQSIKDSYSIYPSECDIEIGNGLLKIGNTSYSYTQESFTSDYSIYLFTLNNGGSHSSIAFTKIGRTQISNGAVSLDLIPAKRNSDNAIGMYDKVNGTFFTNAGTGEFIIPADAKVLPLGYKELEYIESSYTQFIDTGIPLKTATDDVEVDFYVSNLSVAQSIFGARYSTSIRAYSLGISSTDTQWRPSFGSTTENTGTATVGRHVAFMSHNGGTLTVDGTQIISIGNASITTPDGCYVFAIKGNVKIYYSSCRIYSFKIWRSDVLLMHLVPAQRMSDFEAGMYDKVSGTFFANSGTGKFIIPSGQGVTLATKGISANGVYNASDDGVDGYSQVIVNAKPEVVPQKDVNFYDYDGTILYSYTASEFAELTEMPANPIHDGLTSEGWNWSLTDAKTQVSASGACDIGQKYITSDGKTRLYCHFTDDTKSFYFGIAPKGTVVVDWGDGSETDTLTGTSRTTIESVQHTYATAGDYVITLTVSSGYFAFHGTSNTQYIFRKEQSSTANIHNANAACLKKVEVGEDCYLGNFGFNHCKALESITLPKSLPLLGTYTFQYCCNLSHLTIPNKSAISSVGEALFRYAYGLKSVSIPKYVTSVGNYPFRGNFPMQRIVFPNSITSFGTSVVYGDFTLSEVYLPNTITSIPTTVFYQCMALTKLVIPASVTSIATKAFQDCYGMKEYHFKSTTPPTLDNADAFSNMQSDCIIYVPSASLNSYKTASNWNTYASQMVGE